MAAVVYWVHSRFFLDLNLHPSKRKCTLTFSSRLLACHSHTCKAICCRIPLSERYDSCQGSPPDLLSCLCVVFHLCFGCIFLFSLLQQITIKLDLRNNNLKELPRGAFIHTPYLTHLNLQRCNIIRVKEGAFRTLGRVVSLNLAYNKIDILYQVSRKDRTATKKRELMVFTFGQKTAMLMLLNTIFLYP